MLGIQNGAILPMYLHIPVFDISQRPYWCCVFKKLKYRLCLCILLRLIYHKDKTGVVYSKRCSIALCFCILLHLICHKEKLVLCIKKVRYRPMSLHIAASDITQGQKTGVLFSKRCDIALCLCRLLHLIYHKDKKLVLCFQKGAILPYVFAYCCI